MGCRAGSLLTRGRYAEAAPLLRRAADGAAAYPAAAFCHMILREVQRAIAECERRAKEASGGGGGSTTTKKKKKKTKPNDKCPCGSGKKFKKCCRK